MRAIFFYGTRDPYGELSNFWPAPIVIDGVEWPTSEHFFQAAKFFRTDPAWADMIRQAEGPGVAARCGRSRAHPLDPDWEVLKDDVMRLALVAKFTQHADLRARLLETGALPLVEHTRNDAYWGDGSNGPRRGPGRNMLGQLLEALRVVLSTGDPVAHEAAVRARLAMLIPD